MIGTDLAGNNAFLVRNDLTSNFNILSVSEAYKQAQFREAKDLHGNLSYFNITEQRSTIADLDIIDVESMCICKIKDLPI